jgi:hypothetical protein
MQSDRLTVAGITLRTDLDLLLKDELTRQRELSGNILEKSGDRTQDLGVQGRNRKLRPEPSKKIRTSGATHFSQQSLQFFAAVEKRDSPAACLAPCRGL